MTLVVYLAARSTRLGSGDRAARNQSAQPVAAGSLSNSICAPDERRQLASSARILEAIPTITSAAPGCSSAEDEIYSASQQTSIQCQQTTSQCCHYLDVCVCDAKLNLTWPQTSWLLGHNYSVAFVFICCSTHLAPPTPNLCAVWLAVSGCWPVEATQTLWANQSLGGDLCDLGPKLNLLFVVVRFSGGRISHSGGPNQHTHSGNQTVCGTKAPAEQNTRPARLCNIPHSLGCTVHRWSYFASRSGSQLCLLARNQTWVIFFNIRPDWLASSEPASQAVLRERKSAPEIAN